MKKLFLGIIFVVIAAVVSFKGYLWYQVYDQMAGVKEQLSPYAVIKYGSIFSTFDGEVGVRDIEITPYQLKQTVSVGELSVKVDGAQALLKLGDNLAQKKPPQQMLLRMKALSFPIESEFGGMMDSFGGSEGQDAETVFNPFGVYACGNTVAVEGEELQAMGYDHFTVSSEFGYRVNSLANTVSVSVNVDSESMGRSEIKVDINIEDPRVNLMSLSQKTPDVNHVQWDFHDNGYFRRLSFFCGEKAGIERTRYVEQAAQEWSADLEDHGIKLNASLVDAYRKYILDGGLLSIDLRPDENIDYSTLSLFSANDIVSMLNLRIKLNGEYLPDLTLTVDDKAMARMYDREGSDRAETKAEVPIEMVSQEPVKSFKDITVEEASDHLRRRAFVEVDSGRQVEGMIIFVDEHVIEVEQVVAGGKVSYPVRKRKITSIKVWK